MQRSCARRRVLGGCARDGCHGDGLRTIDSIAALSSELDPISRHPRAAGPPPRLTHPAGASQGRSPRHRVSRACRTKGLPSPGSRSLLASSERATDIPRGFCAIPMSDRTSGGSQLAAGLDPSAAGAVPRALSHRSDCAPEGGLPPAHRRGGRNLGPLTFSLPGALRHAETARDGPYGARKR